MAGAVERIEIGGEAGWRLEVAPERGASLTRVAWRSGDGGWREICRRPTPEQIDDRESSLSLLSSFLMAPFVNRVDGARFSFSGEVWELPLNRPQQRCAVHGHSRDCVWEVEAREAGRVVCAHRFASPDSPYVYEARQVFEAGAEAARVSVSVANTGARPGPFGFGLHPWFPRTTASRLRFEAEATFTPDARTFPLAVESLGPETDFRRGIEPAARLGLDRAYAGWGGVAMIDQPDLGYRLKLAGEGAMARNVHIFIAADRPDFCVEPVSHVTDVINRRVFAPYGDMARLQPGESLSGAMSLRAEAL